MPGVGTHTTIIQRLAQGGEGRPGGPGRPHVPHRSGPERGLGHLLQRRCAAVAVRRPGFDGSGHPLRDARLRRPDPGSRGHGPEDRRDVPLRRAALVPAEQPCRQRPERLHRRRVGGHPDRVLEGLGDPDPGRARPAHRPGQPVVAVPAHAPGRQPAGQLVLGRLPALRQDGLLHPEAARQRGRGARRGPRCCDRQVPVRVRARLPDALRRGHGRARLGEPDRRVAVPEHVAATPHGGELHRRPCLGELARRGRSPGPAGRRAAPRHDPRSGRRSRSAHGQPG